MNERHPDFPPFFSQASIADYRGPTILRARHRPSIPGWGAATVFVVQPAALRLAFRCFVRCRKVLNQGALSRCVDLQ
jgi:hypothetical protein